MTIDEAINQAKEIADENGKCYQYCNEDCRKCEEYHKQIVEWLEDYKRLKLKTEQKDKCSECTRRKFYMMGYEAAKQNNGWISVNDGLPENDATVWITYIDNGKELTATAYYDLESGYWYVGYFDYKTKSVTHWQPLSQPPKGE